MSGSEARSATWAMTLPMPRAKCPDKQKLPLASAKILGKNAYIDHWGFILLVMVDVYFYQYG